MKNSASHLPQIQALQIKAEQLLPAIDQALATLSYQDISHQRMSQQNIAGIDYQGLTRATDHNFNKVMIKWQVSPAITDNLSSLNHEIKVLKALSSINMSTQSSITIAPPMLVNKSVSVNIVEENYQLTLLVMPYYPQESLAKYLKQALSIEEKQQLIKQTAQLINSLHKQKWLHNDIKPSNILIDYNSSIINDDSSGLLLTDFALAERIDKIFDADYKIKTAGTPAYLAPERWQGQASTQQSDIYAVGVMIYEILIGKRVFYIAQQTTDPLQAWAIQHCQQPIPILSIQYRDYQLIINKALAKRVENRYQSMTDLLMDLEWLANH